MQTLLFHLHVQVGIETKHAIYPNMTHPSNSIHTLYTEFHLVVGACSSLSDLQRVCHIFPNTAALSAPVAPSKQRSRTAAFIQDMLR